MSASNWDQCPQCLAIEKKNLAKKIARWKASYGKVSVEEFEKSRPDESLPEIPNHMREDYRIAIDDDMVFRMRYHAQCDDCGFDFKTEIIEPTIKEAK